MRATLQEAPEWNRINELTLGLWGDRRRSVDRHLPEALSGVSFSAVAYGRGNLQGCIVRPLVAGSAERIVARTGSSRGGRPCALAPSAPGAQRLCVAFVLRAPLSRSNTARRTPQGIERRRLRPTLHGGASSHCLGSAGKSSCSRGCDAGGSKLSGSGSCAPSSCDVGLWHASCCGSVIAAIVDGLLGTWRASV